MVTISMGDWIRTHFGLPVVFSGLPSCPGVSAFSDMTYSFTYIVFPACRLVSIVIDDYPFSINQTIINSIPHPRGET
jgi:hypothetical protein